MMFIRKEFVYDVMGRKTEKKDILDPVNPVLERDVVG